MKSGLNMIPIWFGSIMILVVVSGAIAFAFTDFMDDRLYGNKRMFFVFLLLSYAVYRGFRLYSALKDLKNNEQ
ncbi:MAG: hypothetical protein PSX36_03570 [bacterium]|nr:hypothetical protein [bacterium]